MFRIRPDIVNNGEIFTPAHKIPARVTALCLNDYGGRSVGLVLNGLHKCTVNNECIHLFAHDSLNPLYPFGIPEHHLVEILNAASDFELPVLSYDLWRRKRPQKAVVLSIDSHHASNWQILTEVLDNYRAKATIFVSKPQQYRNKQMQILRNIQNQGHEIGSHGAMHLKCTEYLRRHSIIDYLRVEVEPSKRHLEQAGLECLSFSYPYGIFTNETDNVLPKYFQTVRGISR